MSAGSLGQGIFGKVLLELSWVGIRKATRLNQKWNIQPQKKLRSPSENRDHFETNVVFQSWFFLRGVWLYVLWRFFVLFGACANSVTVGKWWYHYFSAIPLSTRHGPLLQCLGSTQYFFLGRKDIFLPHRKRGIPEIPKGITSLERWQPSCSFKLMVFPLKSAAMFSTWNLYILVEVAASRGFFSQKDAWNLVEVNHH